METNDQFRQHIKNQYPEQYRQWLKIEEANEEAMKLPKDEMTLRLEALGFRRGAVNALSDTHYFCSPFDKNGEYNLAFQKGDGIYSRSGELSISYQPGFIVWKSYGRILKEGEYTLDEFNQLLDKMDRSHWYREKNNTVKRLPVMSTLQRNIYDALPQSFTWTQGKEIAIKAGIPSRSAQRFFGNLALFEKVRKGTYMKKILFAEM
jgi:hypothetical protein